MAAEAAGVVAVPRLLSSDRGTWLSVAATALGVVGVVVWGVMTQPTLDAAIGAGGVLLVGLLLGALVLRRHELDTTRNALVRAWGPGFRRSVPWHDAEVRLVPNRAGQLVLAVRRPGGRPSYLPILAADSGGPRCQSPGFLRLLADEVEGGGHLGIAGRLRAQADHLDTGGEVLGSPLHRLMATSR